MPLVVRPLIEISKKQQQHCIKTRNMFEKCLEDKGLQRLWQLPDYIHMLDSVMMFNYENFTLEYFNIFNEYPNQISFLSYDLVGLVYFLIYKNNFVINKKVFYEKNKFKGKIGVFEINKNKISHILNFYVAEDGSFKKIF